MRTTRRAKGSDRSQRDSKKNKRAARNLSGPFSLVSMDKGSSAKFSSPSVPRLSAEEQLQRAANSIE